MNKVNLSEKFSLFSEHWTPKIIAELNDYQIKIAKVEGDFVWHNHSDTDEFFLVIEGTILDELIEQDKRFARTVIEQESRQLQELQRLAS